MNIVSLQVAAWAAATVAVFWLSPRRWQPCTVAASAALLLALISPLSLAVLALFTALGYIPMRIGSAG